MPDLNNVYNSCQGANRTLATGIVQDFDEMGIRDWVKEKLSSTLQLNDDDIVVYVVGPSGSGKSLFVREATSSNAIMVGATLHPSTQTPQAIRCELTDAAREALGVSTQRNIVFIDTPSFRTGINDRAEKEMCSWLSKSKNLRNKSALVGTIYMHRVETNPAEEPIQDHLDSFGGTFPQGFGALPVRLHGVLSYEGRVRADRIQQRRETFQNQLNALRASRSQGPGSNLGWDPSLHPKLFRAGDHETAWQAVVQLFA